MKKYIYIAVASLFAFVACEKESRVQEEVAPVEEPEVKELVTITASIPEDGIGTKVALEQDGDNKKLIKLKWEDGDQIVINNVTFTIDWETVSGNYKTADFKGVSTPDADDSGKYNISYTKGFPNVGDDYNNQTQAEDGSTSHLAFSVALNGASDYKSFSFVDGNQGGSLVESSVLRLRAKLPSEASWLSDIEKVIFKSSAAVFNGSETLTVNLTTHGSGGDEYLDVYASLPAGSSVTMPDLIVQFQVSSNAYDVYTAYREFSPEASFPDGAAHYIGINCANIESYANKSNEGIGTSTNPYLIGDQHQMDAIHSELKDDQTKHFKLVDDIDLTGIDWEPLNNVAVGGTFSKYINFDGDFHTVSKLRYNGSDTEYEYPSLFGVLKGTVKNLTIDDAILKNVGSKKAGVLAGYIGTGSDGAAPVVDNIIIFNSSISGGTNYCGGLAGQTNQSGTRISNITISNTSVSTTNTAAGLIAYYQNTATVSDVHIKGVTVTSGLNSGETAIGGLAGRINSNSTFTNCFVEKAEDETASKLSIPYAPTSEGTGYQVYKYAGGLAGYVFAKVATFNNCNASDVTIELTGAVNNNYRYIGGAFGYITGDSVSIGETTACAVINPSFSGAKNYVGGFVGYIAGGTIANSTVSGSSPLLANATVGGFVGKVDGGSFIGNSTSLQIGTDESKVGANNGGFAGNIEGDPTFENCHAVGDVYASGNNIGGFVGYITDGAPKFTSGCYATGDVSSSANIVGGFVGLGKGGSFDSCYANGIVNGNQSVGGFVGKANSASFTACSYRGTSVTGNISSNNAMVGGFCGHTETTACTFIDCYVYNSDSGTSVTGKVQRVGGFIGQLGSSGGAGDSVSKCYVKNVSVRGSGNHYGGFCGVQYASIEKSWVDSGTVTAGGSNIGGFSGYHQKAALTNCFSSATVIGGSYSNIGGITGSLQNEATSTITNCYYNGVLSGSGTRGGIVGSAAGTNCTITGCISWDSSLAVCGSSGTIASCYTKSASETGTILSHAQTIGWDFTTIWNAVDPPTLQ